MTIIPYLQWIKATLQVRPWCVLGQGPSFDRIEQVDLRGYNILALNRSIKHAYVSMVSFIDMQALKDCHMAALAHAHTVVMPWHPHIHSKADPRTLADWLDCNAPFGDTLRDLAEDGRLLSYNSTTAGKLPKHKGLPTIGVRYFSGVAAFALLAAAGVKEISTLGLDGGTDYSKLFSVETCLDNGRKSFDVQFVEIDRICKKHGIKRTAL